MFSVGKSEYCQWYNNFLSSLSDLLSEEFKN